LPGIGPWTAEYIALRALRDPDAFPASDLGLRRAFGALQARGGAAARLVSESALLRAAESWRPWRAYAAVHLWTWEGDHASLDR
jgi:AraC family transcriptional regulator of adaptative response / DNA-3-methyladenine glycosylase II